MDWRIAFVYNSLPERLRQGVFTECSSAATVGVLRRALEETGARILPVNLYSPQQLNRIIAGRYKPDFAFCVAEGYLAEQETLYNGDGAASVRRFLSSAGIPSSHSAAAVMELCRQKEQTYRILGEQGVHCPWNLYLPGRESRWVVEDIPDTRFPLFVKPSGGGSSVGVDPGSAVSNRVELLARLDQLFFSLGNIGVIVETYLPGLEYTVGVIGNSQPLALPPLAFPAGLIRSTTVKRREGRGELPVIPVSSQDPVYQDLRDLAVHAFRSLGASDALRIDIRADSEGKLHVIDVNGTPNLAPSASLAKMAALIGLEHKDLVVLILNYGLTRQGLGSVPLSPGLIEKIQLLQSEEMIA